MLRRRLLLHGARRHLAFGRPPPPAPPPPDPLPELVLGTVIAANLAVFGIWHDRRWQPWMERHFVLTLGGLMHERRWHTMVTNAFSQLQPGHLVANMLMLGMFGRELPRRLGIGGFAALYLSGSLCSSSAWLAEQNLAASRATSYVERARIHGEGCVGASGAVAACVMGACVLDPLRRIYLFFVIPMPAAVFAGGFVLSDTIGLYKTSRPGRQRVAHSGHLGGALAGATVIGVLRFVFRVVR